MSIWTAMINVDCDADDSMTAYLRLPVLRYRRAAAVPGHVLDKLLPDRRLRVRPAIGAADERDWLLSSFIKGIKHLARGDREGQPGPPVSPCGSAM